MGSDGDPDTPPGVGGVALGIGLVIAVVVTFVLAEWHVAQFRRGMGWLAPRMALLLYVVAAVALLGSIVRRFCADRVNWGGLRSWLGRCRFLAFPAAMSGSIMAFLVPLFGSWAKGLRPPITVAGIVPYADGTLWFGGGERLLFNGLVDDYSGKRPLNPALFAVRLALTNVDLRLAMVLEAVLLGVACCLLARVVARHLGLPAALALFAGIYGFVGVFTATTLTETLGVTFGALAVATLWTALHDRNLKLFAAGLFLLSVALGVRPGAIAVLFLVPLWFARSRRGNEGRRVAWPVLAAGAAVVIAGLAMNLAASFSTGGNPANLNSNSMYMVYGLAMGYPGWDITRLGWGKVLEDHPEILPFDDAGRTAAVNRLAKQAVRDHPYRFVKSLVGSETNYLQLAKSQTTFTPNLLVRRVVQAGAGVLGVLALYRRRREGWRSLLVDLGLFCTSLLCLPVFLLWGILAGLPTWLGGALAAVSFCAFVLVGGARRMSPAHSGFLLAAMAGVVVSLPLIGLDSARVLAATAPLMALHLALAVRLLARGPDHLQPGPPEPLAPMYRNRWPSAVAGAGLLAAALVGAPVAAAVVDEPTVARRTCPDDRPAQALLGGASVRVVEDEADERSLDDMDVESAGRDIEMVGGLNVVKTLVKPGTTIIAGINEQGGDRIVFLTGSLRAAGSSVLYFCGDDLQDPTSAVLSAAFWPKPVDFAFMTGTPLAP